MILREIIAKSDVSYYYHFLMKVGERRVELEILDCFVDFIKKLLKILLKNSDEIIIAILGAMLYDLIKKSL